jgi:hypothetical protein
MSAPDSSNIDEALASLRADSADGHAFLQALAARFEDALPHAVRVDRKHGLLSSNHSAKAIEIDAGADRYRVADAGGGRLEATRTRVVRGIALKSERLEIDAWIAGLAQALAADAERSSSAQEALRRLLIGP